MEEVRERGKSVRNKGSHPLTLDWFSFAPNPLVSPTQTLPGNLQAVLVSLSPQSEDIMAILHEVIPP